MKKSLGLILLLLPSFVFAEQATLNMGELLKRMEAGRISEAGENRQREQAFLSDKNQQSKLLADMRQQQRQEEQRSAKLEKQFEDNDKALAEAENRLRERLGSLGELFGHITSSAGDARSNIEKSLVSLQHPERGQFLDRLIEVSSSGVELPSIEQIEKFRFELLREIAEQGHVVQFKADVSEVAGGNSQRDVIRIGVFNAITEDGKYLAYDDGNLRVLARQPSGKYVKQAANFAQLSEGYGKICVDPTGPTGGSLLSALIEAPTLVERWKQGGIVGYVITSLGAFALLLALWRIIYLSALNARVSKQLKDKQANDKNPLGRVLQAAQQYKGSDLDTLELKINEAIIKELPALQSGEALLKIIAAVAPLLGLLGTVTGMIITFQAITIYGAGDPTAMAGGISSALVTTVQGLIVAIPTVLMHTLISGQSKRVIHVLEEQSAGIVAQHQEEA